MIEYVPIKVIKEDIMQKQENVVRLTKLRKTVEVHLPDGRVLQGPRGAAIGLFMQQIQEPDGPPIVGAKVNGELRELTYVIDMDARAAPVTMADADGARIYRRSITFLLEVAFEELFPAGYLTIDHSVASGGFFCQVSGRPALTADELKQLTRRMNEMVDADLPFDRKTVTLTEAIDYFKNAGQDDKVKLLAFRQKGYLVLYTLGKHRDYHHGYMVPSTGYLQWFGLFSMGDGFILHYPRRNSPTALLPMPGYPKLLATFREYGDWLARLGIESVGALNAAIQDKRIREVVLVSEALHEQKIADIAAEIARKRDALRIVLIAGPSSSGKTTFSKRLAVQLISQGLPPFALEMDNYFVDREQTPKDTNGDYDYETVRALNLELLSDNIQRLIAGEKVQLPRYSFKQGKSEPGETIQLQPGQLIVMEGIHGLNPSVLEDVPADAKFKIYVSCLTQLNLDRHNRISTTDTRLIRRIVRDARERGYSAQQTIQRWESVRRGEKEHIFPYQENADRLFNSALAYELSALKPLVEPLLRQVPYNTDEYIEAKRLLAFLEWFLPAAPDLIPDNSILREFVGESILSSFMVWKG